MRVVASAALGLLISSLASAASVHVRIETGGQPRPAFLVSVTGHYAGFHNGHSHRLQEVLLREGRHTIDVGLVNPLTSTGVSIGVYHPAYVSEYARSGKTPLPLRPVRFEPLRPRLWREVIAAGKPLEGNPLHQLNRVVGHLRLFLEGYLPAVDESDLPDSDRDLAGYVPVLESLVRYATESAPAAKYSASVESSRSEDATYDYRLRARELEQRYVAEDMLRRTQAWLTLSLADRRTVRRLMADMRSPQAVGETLMRDSDRKHLSTFLERRRQDRASKRETQPDTSWRNEDNSVEYRIHVLDPPRDCSLLSITTDLTAVVSADLGDMTSTVKAIFCRRGMGDWRYGRL